MKIGLLSDTHSYIDDRILELLRDCDEIWHAGDIGDLAVTDALETVAPVRAVFGNIDDEQIRRTWPLHERFEIHGLDIWMTHIGGRPGRYDMRIREQFWRKPPNIFICGHSHICRVEMDKKAQCLYINPGAAGVKGFHKVRTLIRFNIANGRPENMEVVELGKREGRKSTHA